MTQGEHFIPHENVIVVRSGCGAESLRRILADRHEAALENETGAPPLESEVKLRVDCLRCHSSAFADSVGGLVVSRRCDVGLDDVAGAMPTCDLELIRTRPELYQDEQGEPIAGAIACSAQCGASVEWRAKGTEVKKVRPHLIGNCAVNAAGESFRALGKEGLNAVMPHRPAPEAKSDEIPAFDGEPGGVW